MLDEIPTIEVGNIQLEPNSTFVLYTDGLIELENQDGDFFGVPRLIKQHNPTRSQNGRHEQHCVFKA